MEITFPALASINNAVNLAYNTQFFIAERRCDPFTFDATSTGDAEVYPRLDLIGGLRIRVGSDVWDGSVRGRLDRLDQELAAV